jgi:uncharacterized membrane protein YoaT (DUF817 family)
MSSYTINSIIITCWSFASVHLRRISNWALLVLLTWTMARKK